jgi:VanZ family protein
MISGPRTTAILVHAAWIGYWLLLATATHVPVPDLGEVPFDWFDKAVHVTLYGGLTLLSAWACARRRAGPDASLRDDLPRTLWRWAAFYVIFAALDEWTQQFVNRTPSWFDWLADAIGVTLGSVLAILIFRRAGRRRVDQSQPAESTTPL